MFPINKLAMASAPTFEIPQPEISISVQYGLSFRAPQSSSVVSSGELLYNELLARFTRVKASSFAWSLSIQVAGIYLDQLEKRFLFGYRLQTMIK